MIIVKKKQADTQAADLRPAGTQQIKSALEAVKFFTDALSIGYQVLHLEAETAIVYRQEADSGKRQVLQITGSTEEMIPVLSMLAAYAVAQHQEGVGFNQNVGAQIGQLPANVVAATDLVQPDVTKNISMLRLATIVGLGACAPAAVNGKFAANAHEQRFLRSVQAIFRRAA